MLKRLELSGFKSFAKKTTLEFPSPITAIVGPNGSGKSNVAEAIKFVLGEQSHLSMRTKKGEDLIWNGSKMTPSLSRAGVAIFFDNTKQVFKLDSELAPDLDLSFDEIVLSREVYRDGGNKYAINGTQVRLRDIVELLASVNIGASGHHIISQGEADRILNASPKDRRIMVEEALGLKIHHWKIHESEKKLEKTNENLEKAESLRRELAPHIKFLAKQVERVEKAEEMRTKLAGLYAEYLKKEEYYIAREKSRAAKEKHAAEDELSSIENTIRDLKEALSGANQMNRELEEASRLDQELNLVRTEKEELTRNLGRIEAKIDFIHREQKDLERKRGEASGKTVPYKEVESLATSAEAILGEAEKGRTAEELIGIIFRVRKMLVDFLSHHLESESEIDARLVTLSKEAEQTLSEKESVELSLSKLSASEKERSEAIKRIKENADKNKDEAHEKERVFYELTANKSERVSELNLIRLKEEGILREEQVFLEELKEGGALIGEAVLGYKRYALDEAVFQGEPRTEQERRRKEIEKIKIRLEDMGASGGADMLAEYKDMQERDEFLSREIEDMRKSAETLISLIGDLKEKLDSQFESGIEKINNQFEYFFTLMFGGGAASIYVFEEKRKTKEYDPETGEEIEIEDDEEPERGIEIKVNLPQKKIRDLAMLSGGERALTSIALLFAITQVNPPPFLVLDETDAALDEANSRKYGDMLENLSKLSQLVVITHNRETMSRAGILYGITTGGDAVSKLLSIKFDEAVAIAK